SSSGVLVVTGTGATGWGRSIHRDHRSELVLPAPVDARLAYFVREAFPSPTTGTSLVEGIVEPGSEAAVRITSRMESGGTIFGDGIEADHVNFEWGMTATIELAAKRLHLVR
ncbi:MAG: NrtR-regulated OrfY protein, partial [Thermoleophilia bacterium]|nr:NrtR-regulated OrfY protein [Thermoleophilia bacterium]